jgi:transposase-like protein
MSKQFQDYIYFNNPQENKEFIEYVYKRNSQLYELLNKGMPHSEASELFGLAINSIKTMYKAFRHKFNIQRSGYQRP